MNPETGDDIRKEKMLRSFSGFASRPTNTLKCGHCRRRGHIISQCPDMERRVSLSKSAIVLTPRGEAAMEVEEESTANAIRPEDSVSSQWD